MGRTAISSLLSFVGAVIGGAVGVAIFAGLKRFGLYAMVVPGASLGLGCLMLSRSRSTIRGAVVALLAIGLGLTTEWLFFPNDRTFPEFLRHLPELGGREFFMIGLGGVFAFWWGRDASPFFSPPRPDRKLVQVKDTVRGE